MNLNPCPLLAALSIAAAAPNAALPHPVMNPSSSVMLAGDWVPADPHTIDF